MQARRGIKRIIFRVWEELRATAKIARVVSVSGAIATLLAKVDIQRLNRNGYRETPAIRKRLIRKHQVLLAYFEKTMKIPENIGNCSNKPSMDKPIIWMCWWQGVNQAPEIVKACVKSVQKNAKNAEVRIITEESYQDYVSIPNWIQEKYLRGIISKTHYSDLLRLFLLAEYGGLWLDATFFAADDRFSEHVDDALWTIRRPGYGHISAAMGEFATYALGCCWENRWIFATIRDYVMQYWKNNDLLIDYLVLDYLIVLAQKRNPDIAEAFRQIAPNNDCCDDLCSLLGKPYQAEIWKKIRKNTSLYKLTWKQTFPVTIDGQITFYGKLLEGDL